MEVRCQRSMIFCTQYQFKGWYTRIGPNPDSGSPASETITDRFIHKAYEVLVDGHVSMHERNGLKSSHTEGGEEDYDGPFNPAYFPCELEMDLMIF